MVGTRRSRSKAPAVSLATTLPSRMTTMRSAVSRISPSRCEIRMQLPPCRDEAADKGEQLAGRMRHRATTSARPGSPARSGSSVTVKARATSTIWRLPIGQVARRRRRRRCRGREKSRRACRAISAPARRRQPKPLSEAWMTRVFSATVRLGQSDSSWNTQRMPSCLRAAATE